jgi:hypothetical protein
VLGVQAGLVAVDFATSPPGPRAGRLLTASFGARRLDTGTAVRSGTIRCSARIAGQPLRLATKGFRNGRAFCTWRIPSWTRGQRIRGSVAVRRGTFSVERSFSKVVRG